MDGGPLPCLARSCQLLPTHQPHTGLRAATRSGLAVRLGSAGGFLVGLGSLPRPPWAEGFADLARNRSRPRTSAGLARPAWLFPAGRRGPTGCQAHRSRARARGSAHALERARRPHTATPGKVSHRLVRFQGTGRPPSQRRCCQVPAQKVPVVDVRIPLATGAQRTAGRCPRGGARRPWSPWAAPKPREKACDKARPPVAERLRGGDRAPREEDVQTGGFSGDWPLPVGLAELGHSRLAAVSGRRRAEHRQLRGSCSPQGRSALAQLPRAGREGRWGLSSHNLLLVRPRPERAAAGLTTASVSPCRQQSGRM